MIQLFFEYVVHDFESGKGSDDLVACLNKAYERTLEPYHGYMAQQLFSVRLKLQNGYLLIAQLKHKIIFG